MSRQAQAMIVSISIDATKKFRRSFYFVAANSDSHHVAVSVTRCEFKNFLRLLDSEVPGSVENPEQRNPEIARATGPRRVPALQK